MQERSSQKGAREKIKTLAVSFLFAVGVVQIVLGVIGGRLRIYAIEALFWRDLGLSAQHSRAFSHYLGVLKDQWHVVAWLGVVTICSTGLLLWALSSKKVTDQNVQ